MGIFGSETLNNITLINVIVDTSLPGQLLTGYLVLKPTRSFLKTPEWMVVVVVVKVSIPGDLTLFPPEFGLKYGNIWIRNTDKQII
jgi:hypothetical protein